MYCCIQQSQGERHRRVGWFTSSFYHWPKGCCCATRSDPMLPSSPQRCGGSCAETAGGTRSSHYPSSRWVPRIPAGLHHTHDALHIRQSRMSGYSVHVLPLLFPVAAALVHLIGQENHEWGVWMLFMALQSHQLNKQVCTHTPQVPCTHWSCVGGEG